MNTSVNFNNHECYVELGLYSNQRLAIYLVDKEKDTSFIAEPVLMATLNLPDLILASDEVCIKDYGCNDGILTILQQAGYLNNIVKSGASKNTKVSIVKKTPALILKEIELKAQFPRLL